MYFDLFDYGITVKKIVLTACQPLTLLRMLKGLELHKRFSAPDSLAVFLCPKFGGNPVPVMAGWRGVNTIPRKGE